MELDFWNAAEEVANTPATDTSRAPKFERRLINPILAGFSRRSS
jgi:hypothetical protein